MYYLRLSFMFLTFLFIIGITTIKAEDLTLTTDGKVPGKPFEALQNQIDTLNAKLDSIQISAGMYVYDANDQELGIFAGITDYNIGFEIFLVEKQRLISLDLESGRTRIIIDYLFFESSDCTGVSYVQAQTNKPIQEIFFNAYTNNYVVLSLNPQTVYYNSWVSCGIGGTCSECKTIMDSNTLHEAIEFPIDELPFSYPVQPPLRIEYKK